MSGDHPAGYRIVVDYEGREDLVLLAAFDTSTDQEIDLDEPQIAALGFPMARRYAAASVDEAHELVESPVFENGEGVVIRFASGLRLKLKREEYQRLHRIVTGVTPRRIWEMLKDGSPPIGRLFAGTPAGFQTWARARIDEIQGQHAEIEQASRAEYARILAITPEDRPDQKTFALEAAKHWHRAVLFRLYDDAPFEEIIWSRLPWPGRPVPQRRGLSEGHGYRAWVMGEGSASSHDPSSRRRRSYA